MYMVLKPVQCVTLACEGIGHLIKGQFDQISDGVEGGTSFNPFSGFSSLTRMQNTKKKLRNLTSY